MSQNELKQPPIITYNLKERGRKFTGKERNFNCANIARAINSQATQEKVRLRQLIGYYGHKVRQLSGLDPSESVIIAGKYNSVEPAIVTTFLEASPDGTIKHKTEFLDNDEGRKANRMWLNKNGGFSSAIDEIANEFYGFDFVLAANYQTNAGYTLDDANGITYDSVMAEVQHEHELFYEHLLAQKSHQLSDALIALDSVQAENEELFSLLTEKNNGVGIVLDGLGVSPLRISSSKTDRLIGDINSFGGAKLSFQLTDEPDINKPEDAEYRATLSRYSR